MIGGGGPSPGRAAPCVNLTGSGGPGKRGGGGTLIGKSLFVGTFNNENQ
jgi:hypothetical protein